MATTIKLNPKMANHQELVEKDLYKYMVPIFSQFYPNFKYWYFNKVVPGFAIGERIIYIILWEGKIYGVSIIKLSIEEGHNNKICSFYISEEMRGNKNGIHLMSLSLSEFNSGYPIVITVPEERIFETFGKKTFLSFLEGFGFKVVSVIDGKYRPNKKEYIMVRK